MRYIRLTICTVPPYTIQPDDMSVIGLAIYTIEIASNKRVPRLCIFGFCTLGFYLQWFLSWDGNGFFNSITILYLPFLID